MIKYYLYSTYNNTFTALLGNSKWRRPAAIAIAIAIITIQTPLKHTLKHSL